MPSEKKEIVVKVPQEMVDSYYNDFHSITRESLEEIRELIAITIEVTEAEPELLQYNEYKEDLIRAFAMKLALQQRGILYDA